jgi:hypothetical protein
MYDTPFLTADVAAFVISAVGIIIIIIIIIIITINQRHLARHSAMRPVTDSRHCLTSS